MNCDQCGKHACTQRLYRISQGADTVALLCSLDCATKWCANHSRPTMEVTL